MRPPTHLLLPCHRLQHGTPKNSRSAATLFANDMGTKAVVTFITLRYVTLRHVTLRASRGALRLRYGAL